MPNRELRANIAGGDDIVRICHQRVIGGSDLSVEPCLDHLISCEQGTQSVTDDLAFAGVLAGTDSLAHGLGHVNRESDAQLPLSSAPASSHAAVGLNPTMVGRTVAFPTIGGS